jgi:hypothetical protein
MALHAIPSPRGRDANANARRCVGRSASTIPIAGIVQKGRSSSGKRASLRAYAEKPIPGKKSKRSGNQTGCGFSIITAMKLDEA